MSDIKVYVDWKAELAVVITIEDWDYFSPDEFIPTCGWLELDVQEGHWTPALRQIQAQFEDEPERYFFKALDDPRIEMKVYEDGLQQHAENEAGLAERYAAERDDWFYHLGKESRREFRRSF